MFVFFVALCCSAARLNSRYTNKNIKQIVLPKNAKNGVACDMCKQVVTYIETLLSTTGEEEIITLVEQLCETFPSPYSSLCDSLAEQYVPVIIEWLEQEIEALDICTQIGLCTETKALKGKKNLQRIPRKLILPKNIKNGVACDMCKQVVSYIETLISTAAEEEIIALVEQLCETFPSPYSSICDALAEQYVSVIIDLINQGIEVLDICTNLGLCTESKLRVKRVAPKLAFQKKAILPKKVTLPKNVKNGVACDMCKQVITFVETLFETTAEEEIISLVKQLCETFPSPYSSVCDVIAEQYIPYIIKLIEEGIETLDICSQLGFCTESKQRIQKIQHKLVLPKNKKNGLACDMCTDLVSYIENLLATSGEEEIIALVEEYCNTFEAPYSTLCKAVVEEYVPMIIEWLGQEIEALDICNSLGLCTQTKLKVKRNLRKLVLPKNAKNGVACDMCKQVVTYIETLISTTGEEEIIALVEQLCETFPSPYSSLCDSVVESFVPTIIDLINQGIEALDICTQIGLCTETKLKVKRNIRKLVLPKNAKNGVACDMCKQVVTYIETLLSTTGEEEIIALVEQLCETFPSPYSSLCDSLAEQYVPVIIEWLEQEIEALDICTQIGLCTETKLKMKRLPRKLVLPKNAKNGVACDMCKQVVTYIETLISTTGEEEIIALVEQLCETFPSPYSSLCDSVVESFVPTIIDLINQGIEALDICTQIGLCTETKLKMKRLPRKLVLPKNAKNGVACDMCKQVVTYIETLISTTGEEEIIALVEQLCETFPSPYSSLCDSVVESFVPTIIDLINQGIEALDICTQIGLCTETQIRKAPRKVNTVKKLAIPQTAVNGVACDMCKQVVTYIETLLSTTGEEEIIALVEQLCETFPSPYSSLCDSLAEQYVPVIIEWLEQEIEALDICTQIGLCTETQEIPAYFRIPSKKRN